MECTSNVKIDFFFQITAAAAGLVCCVCILYSESVLLYDYDYEYVLSTILWYLVG